MVRIDTSSIIALVHHNYTMPPFTFRNRANKMLIRQTVSANGFDFIPIGTDPKTAIPSTRQCSNPKPAPLMV